MSSSAPDTIPAPDYDEGGDALAQTVVCDTDHRSLDNRRVVVESILHFGRVDHLATGEDHVLLTVDDVEIAFGVDRRQITGRGTSRRERPRRWPRAAASSPG